MKTFRCSDGFVTKTITANSARGAAETFAIVTSNVQVSEVDGDGNEISTPETIKIEIAE